MVDAPPQRVVIIDDTEDLRELLRLALTRGGFDVVAEAGDGREGIEVVRAERPDLVMLDLSMPVMDGLEALPSIRRLCPEAAIVVLSGFGATQMSERALAAGADGYLQKGGSLKSILAYVREITDDRLAVRVPAPRVAPARPEPITPGEPPTPDALDQAPFGVLELADEPLFRIKQANAMARRLLGHEASPGTPLGLASSELAGLVGFHRLADDASFQADLGGVGVRAVLRRTAGSVLVYLDSTSDDVDALRRAIATTAHELRGPVSVLRGIAEASEWPHLDGDDDRDEADRRLARLLGSVVRQARTLDRLTADLLTTSQVRQGTLHLDVREIDIRTLLETTLGARGTATPFSVQVEDERALCVDEGRTAQMLENLLNNAERHGAGPYGIRVRPDDDPALVAIDVIDHGDGVPAVLRELLFEEFTQGQAALHGTGLGLYITRTLAEAHGGHATYADGEHGGAVFTLHLPAAGTPPDD